MMRQLWINETRRLLAVDSFVKITVQEGVGHIHLIDGPGLGSGKSKDYPNGGRFNNRTESLPIIHAGLSSEAANHPASLLPRQSAVRVHLVSINPFTGNHVRTWRTRNQRPSVILQQSIKFIEHCSAPIWIFEFLAI
jgi:hypothetical protein